MANRHVHFNGKLFEVCYVEKYCRKGVGKIVLEIESDFKDAFYKYKLF